MVWVGRYYFIYNVGETNLPPLPLPEPNVPEDPCQSTAQMSALRVEVPEIIQLPRFVLCWNGLEPAHSKEHIIPMGQKIPAHYLFGTNMAFREAE